jgi:hypothetical protein
LCLGGLVLAGASGCGIDDLVKSLSKEEAKNKNGKASGGKGSGGGGYVGGGQNTKADQIRLCAAVTELEIRWIAACEPGYDEELGMNISLSTEEGLIEEFAYICKASSEDLDEALSDFGCDHIDASVFEGCARAMKAAGTSCAARDRAYDKCLDSNWCLD